MIDQRTAPYAIFCLRVTLGLFAIAHLYYKYAVVPGGVDGWWANLTAAGYPDWVVIYVLSAEFLGAVLLIPGICARWVALYAVPLMLAAAIHWFMRKGYFFTAAGAELPTLWTIALLVQAGLGDGAYAMVRSPTFPFINRVRHPAHA